MKNKYFFIVIFIIAMSFCSCTKKNQSNNIEGEQGKISDEGWEIQIETSVKDGNNTGWNGTFEASDGSLMSLVVTNNNKVNCDFIFYNGVKQYFPDDIVEFPDEKTIVMFSGNRNDEVKLTLEKDSLTCEAWATTEDGEKNIYYDETLTRSTKSIDSLTKATVASEDRYETFIMLDENGKKVDDSENTMGVCYSKDGYIQFDMYFVMGYNTYASYSSASEMGTYTSCVNYSGTGEMMEPSFLGNLKIEISGDYAYVTWESSSEPIKFVKE